MPGITVAKRRLFIIIWLIGVREPATSSPGVIASNLWSMGMSCPAMPGMSMAVMFQSALLNGVVLLRGGIHEQAGHQRREKAFVHHHVFARCAPGVWRCCGR